MKIAYTTLYSGARGGRVEALQAQRFYVDEGGAATAQLAARFIAKIAVKRVLGSLPRAETKPNWI